MAAVRAFLKDSGSRAWLVGGTVRDLLKGRSPVDIDLVTDGDPRALARAFADGIGGSFFTLSERFKACRVVGPTAAPVRGNGQAQLPSGSTWDFVGLRGATIEDDLRQRDYIVNAMAVELPAGGAVIDPLGGQADLAAGRLAAASAAALDEDPLRLIRGARLEKTAGLRLDAATEEAIRERARRATEPAAERTFAELVMLLEAPGAAAAVRRLDKLGLLEALLPELTALKGVTQNDYHHLDVYEHTLANCEALDSVIGHPENFFPEQALKLRERQRLWVAGDAGWAFMMSAASLLHDVAKPFCRFTDTDGQVRFFEHDRRGASMVAAILGRFKAGAAITGAVSFLVGRHMRFEGLLQQKPPSQRARLRYLRATEPWTRELIMLSVSDRLSVRGVLVTGADIEEHLALTREMMSMCYAEAEAEPRPRLIGGDALMAALGMEPGPEVGRLLDHIREEQELGLIATREEALAAARAFLEGQ